MGKTDGYQYMFMFTMVKYCATETSVLPDDNKVFHVLAPLLKQIVPYWV